ncbi:hypothetical protein SO802_006947 [Lithocarpus litseifolius]|uniref:Protein kinase domain-containing protein n=1 Tax=Lithocarpus litseifolius TaxID=425828 RepID=A0AAW2DP02_9ROSI
MVSPNSLRVLRRNPQAHEWVNFRTHETKGRGKSQPTKVRKLLGKNWAGIPGDCQELGILGMCSKAKDGLKQFKGESKTNPASLSRSQARWYRTEASMEGILQSISKLIWTSRTGRSDETKQSSSVLPEGLCRQFSLAEIKIATNDFADDFVIGEGRFCKVYKGFIDNRGRSVAIKRGIMSRQSSRELKNEVASLCQLNHSNLIPFIGYCIDHEGENIILVFEFMVNGILSDQIYGTDHDPLPWKQRLQICIGVARGLHYLHTGLKHSIIHGDVKTSTILLDEKWEAKLGDFELSKMGPPSLSKDLRWVVSRIEGTYGYMAPEYVLQGELTDKSEVYSFGVILLEVLCARNVFERKRKQEEEEQIDLVKWARKCKREGTMNEIIDPYLMGKIAPECFKIYVDIASSCLRDEGKDRPAMGEVEVGLEHALELQESADAARKDELTCNDSPIEMNRYGRSATPSTVENFFRDSDSTELSKDE